LPNINKLKAQNALAFHREIEAAVTENLKLEEYRRSFSVVPIAGVQQPTLQSARLENSKLTASEDLPDVLRRRLELADGDGTVPQISAIPLERSQNLDNFFIAEKHGSLQNQNQVLDNLRNSLELSQFDLSTIRAPQSAISICLDDLYLPDELIQIRARITGPLSFGKLQAEITAVDSDRPPLHLDFVEQEQGWGLVIEDLPAGLYRIQVQTEQSSSQAPTAVHDLFEVVRQ
jgi:hypothetical protein